MITQGARVGRGSILGRRHHLEPLDPGDRCRDRRRAGPGPRPRLVAWPSRRRGAGSVPGGRVLPPLRPGHQAAHRRGAPRQVPADRHPPPARRLDVTVGMPDGLFGLATALVAIPSVSHHEELDGRRRSRPPSTLCPWLAVERVGDNVVARTDLGRDIRVLLGGHLDTVPPVGGNEEPRIEDDVLFGVGAADMKGGLAVLLHLAGCLPEPAVDVTWCFYVCEEVEQEFNGLRHLWEQRPELLARRRRHPRGAHRRRSWRPDARARCGSGLSLGGARAHTARPATGRNAIHRLAPVLAAAAGYREPRPGARRVRVRRAAPGRRGLRRGGRQRRARRGLGAGQPPLRSRPHRR